ncbi:MAG: phosphoribosylformylglycinamidine synthase subunit PurS [Bacteroidota bacterium]
MFKATVIVKRRPTILDPQGKAVEQGAKLLGFNNVRSTRIGKYIEFFVDTTDKNMAEKEVREYSEKLLSNPIMEDFEFTLSEWTPSKELAK